MSTSSFWSAQRPLHRLAFSAGLALMSCVVSAQPTGNPAGSAGPDVRGQAAKPPATRAPQSNESTDDQQKGPAARQQGAQTNPDNPAARSGHSRTPGSGTAGGLSGRHPQGERSAPQKSDDPGKPAQKQKPPSPSSRP